jgi:hypothetical protein
MSSVSPASLALARRLLALEAARENSSAGVGGRLVDTVRVCEKLRSVLTAFAGTAGFRSLLTRALALAKAQEPSLAGLQVLEDGSLAGFEKVGAEKSKGAAGGQVLVAQLLDLLIVFIGEPLTLQLVRSAWPDAPASAIRSRTEDSP